MSLQPNKISSLEIERLVDGQLSDAEYRRVVDNLSQDPDGWRRCCLAFLEHQALRSDLAAVNFLIDDGITPPPAANRSDSGHFLLNVREDWDTEPTRRGPSIGHWIKSPLWGGRYVDADTTASSVSNVSPDPDKAPNTPQRTHVPQQVAVLRIQDPQRGDAADMQIPLQQHGDQSAEEANRPRSNDGSRNVRSADVNSALSKIAKPTQVERRLFPMATPDGRLLLLPVNFVRIKCYQ
jgi:hypothetical protein